MKFYIQLDKNKIIRDIITYKYKNYKEIELEEPLPIGINGGWYKYEDEKLVEISELNPENIEIKIQKAIDEFTMTLLEWGMI